MTVKQILGVFVAVLILVGLVGCAASDRSGKSSASQPVQTTASLLTAEEVQNVALEHAGLTADQVTHLRCHYDADDPVPAYEVEFRQGDYEYDYNIHAVTGEILEQDREFDPEKPPVPTTVPPTQESATEPATQTMAPAAQPKLAKEQAQTIALTHAGLKADQVKGLKTEYDIDDGVPEYSVEFYADGYELEYEIHADTGEILEHHKEKT